MRRIVVFLLSVFLAGTVFAAGSGGGGGGASASSGGSSGTAAAPSAVDLYNSGYAASQAGKHSEAVNYFQKAIDAKRDYAEAYNMLGFSMRKMGNVAKAFGYYETALKLKPNFPEAREYYGEAYLQQGNLAKAVQQYIILEKAGSKNAEELLEKIEEFVNQKS